MQRLVQDYRIYVLENKQMYYIGCFFQSLNIHKFVEVVHQRARNMFSIFPKIKYTLKHTVQNMARSHTNACRLD